MAGVVALVLGSATACGSVDIPATDVSGTQRAACERLVGALPDQVSDQPRRETGGNSLGAAWGDPAIVLRCGVGIPRDYDFIACQRVNGLDWFVPDEASDDQDLDVVMTTIGRRPAVEVTLPATYRPPMAAMVDLGETIKENTQVTRPCS